MTPAAGRRCSIGFAALLVLALPATQTVAQAPAQSAECLPRASRAVESCDSRKVVVRVETEVKLPLEIPAVKTASCAVTIEVEYTQRDTSVKVDGTIENKNCAASSGEFKLAVRTRNENRELMTVDFFESWQTQAAEPLVRFQGSYSIGENVDVVGVRPVQLRCTCADAAAPNP